MSTPAAILIACLLTLGFGAIGWYLRRLDAKVDRIADRLTEHEIKCAGRWKAADRKNRRENP